MKKHSSHWIAILSTCVTFCSSLYAANAGILATRGKNFDSYDTIVAQMENLGATNSDFARVFDASFKTDAGQRTVKGLVLTDFQYKSDPNEDPFQRPSVIIVGVTHARELITAKVVMNLANAFLKGDGKPSLANTGVTLAAFQEQLKRCCVVLVPVMNPDGYEYARTTDDDWRKNRADQSDVGYWQFAASDPDFTGAIKDDVATANGFAGDVGVDLNRNFPFQWHPPKSASIAPSDYEGYRGRFYGSEVETANVMRFFQEDFRNNKASIFFHSPFNKVFYPWGYQTDAIAASRRNLHTNAHFLVDNDVNVFGFLGNRMTLGTNYEAKQSSKEALASTTSGVAHDWAYSQCNNASFTIEVKGGPDAPDHDYFNPESVDAIQFVCDENVAPALLLINWAASGDMPAVPGPVHRPRM